MLIDKFQKILNQENRWLVTGAAGFIGSHLVENLLKLNQKVIGLDNFSTGHHSNLDDIQSQVDEKSWANFEFIEGDISCLNTCEKATKDIDHVLHHAALGSVPLSIEKPLEAHQSNVTGFINLLETSRLNGVKRFVYASSSAVYGDEPSEAKTENLLGEMLSPYAVSKRIDEIYARIYHQTYGFETVGLRYFNVFGPRQDPNGAYAAVIPKWIDKIFNEEKVEIYGTGETSRDFCYVDNIVFANFLAATTQKPEALNQVFNVGLSDSLSLNELIQNLVEIASAYDQKFHDIQIEHQDFRKGDILHSKADIALVQSALGFEAVCQTKEGLEKTVEWFFNKR